MWLIKYANTRIDGSFEAKMAEGALGYWGFSFGLNSPAIIVTRLISGL